MATYARVRRLTKQGDRDIGPTFRRLAELLRNSRSTGTLRCTILVGDKSRSWTFELKGRDCRLLRDAATLPDLEIITLEPTWVEIADGRLSPLDAFTQGRMRILGDTALGSRLLRHVAESGGATSICGG
jgi:SCP-2 sterol transfer family